MLLFKSFCPNWHVPHLLSGIVQQGGALVTTDPTMVFQYHLPYLTCEGTPANLSVAAGPAVTGNLILSIPFITQTKMVIDTSDQIAKMCVFDTPPIPIDFPRMMCTINNAEAVANAALYVDTVKKIENIDAHVMKMSKAFLLQQTPSTLPGSILLLIKRAQSVKFHDISSNSTVSTTYIGSTINQFNHNTNACAKAFDLINLPSLA
jgi:hypothetical protein